MREGVSLAEELVPNALEQEGWKVLRVDPDPKIPIRDQVWFRAKGWHNILHAPQVLLVDEVVGLEADASATKFRNGIWTLDEKELCNTKLTALLGDNARGPERFAARDLYDAAFWLQYYPSAVPREAAQALRTLAEQSVAGNDRDRWAKSFARDAILGRTSLLHVEDALLSGLEVWHAQDVEAAAARSHACCTVNEPLLRPRRERGGARG